MKKFRKLKIFILVFSFLLFIAGGFAAYKYISNKPPEKEIKNAIEALSAAKKAQASKFAKGKFNEAEGFYNKAMDEWKKQNEKFFISRDYTIVIELANRSVQLSNEALKNASAEKSTVSSNLKNQLAELNKQIGNFERYFKNLPLSKSTFEKFSSARMKYNEATTDFNKGQIYEAGKLAADAGKLILQATNVAKNLLNDFYEDFSTWKKDAHTARQLSSKGHTVVLVNKLESTCSVLRSGKTLAVFSAEFGPNWMGDKKRMGDMATPQGMYKITQKKSNGKTKYYKSLLINYPNEEDKSRFSKLIKSGIIPKNSKIGGLIEIHGNGGKGVHWTEGCVALRDSDMDKLYNYCSVNTQVIIIGSEKPMSDYFK